MKLGDRGKIWERDNEKKGVYSDKEYSIYPFGRKASTVPTPEYRDGWDRVFVNPILLSSSVTCGIGEYGEMLVFPENYKCKT